MIATVPLKAYAVLEHSENTGAVFFARYSIVARRKGADEFADGDIAGVSCRRAPWADAYATTGLPAAVCIDHGWNFECWGCGAKIDEYWLDENSLTSADVVGNQRGSVYCCAGCKERSEERQRQVQLRKAEAIEMAKRLVLNRFPGAQFREGDGFTHAYVTDWDGHWLIASVQVAFDFPGMAVAPATFRIEADALRFPIGNHVPRYYCAAGDREAFEAYAAATKARGLPAAQ
ncbi:hypothetical protein [Aminobacter sp. MDW-2]|uniref:hypothetical protein n=1 Tax=Aminobacter sp. MDW-2 TaxID=2666139 RepID=UPI0012AEEB75|nr:hypothetical protein [Aminobacter sp. MDW-2]MRX32835.1 hypothetical protein [Aminobacter sp. MDW-2]QNH34508.1 hypothetical protein H5P29_00700 [Aminobacter sp. MDW-2]